MRGSTEGATRLDRNEKRKGERVPGTHNKGRARGRVVKTQLRKLISSTSISTRQHSQYPELPKGPVGKTLPEIRTYIAACGKREEEKQLPS